MTLFLKKGTLVRINQLVLISGLALLPTLISAAGLDLRERAVKAPEGRGSRSLMQDIGGTTVFDAGAMFTGHVQFNTALDLVGVSTPTYTISPNHANLWLNNTAKQICTRFDNGTSGCFGTSFSVAWGSIGGTLSNQTDLQTKFNLVGASTGALQGQISTLTTTYLTLSSATATYLQPSVADTTYLSLSSATATYLQKSSATATYLQPSQLIAGSGISIVGVSSRTISASGALQISSQCLVNVSSATTKSTWAKSNLACTITPSSASSRIKIEIHAMLRHGNVTAANFYYSLSRGDTDLGAPASAGFGRLTGGAFANASFDYTHSMSFIDSPATTSATTYYLTFRNDDNATTVTVGTTGYQVMILTEIQ